MRYAIEYYIEHYQLYQIYKFILLFAKEHEKSLTDFFQLLRSENYTKLVENINKRFLFGIANLFDIGQMKFFILVPENTNYYIYYGMETFIKKML